MPKSWSLSRSLWTRLTWTVSEMGRKQRSDWRDVIRADVAAMPQAKTDRIGLNHITTDFRQAAYGMLAGAARMRRLSLAAYVRRATLAMVAYDLGIDFRQLLEVDPRVSRETGFPVNDPDGTLFGPWAIAALETEAEPA